MCVCVFCVVLCCFVLCCVVDGVETRTDIFINTVACSEKSLNCAENKWQSRALCIPGPQSSPSVLLYMSQNTHMMPPEIGTPLQSCCVLKGAGLSTTVCASGWKANQI